MVRRLENNRIGTESYKRRIKFPLTPDLTSQRKDHLSVSQYPFRQELKKNTNGTILYVLFFN